ncbi:MULTISPECIES: hypothetical protein [Streptomyces]|uniref:Uncharacterized protein n=1 Tax=Streptomyces changanensis TaxID=2964669 RepID=A0ABY5NDC6_9ACTN|nr:MULTISPECIES: hypothetical protein [Streptomyces]UUS33946.1 hypothetical protein NRO40_26065 [Streptomyces changanensis]
MSSATASSSSGPATSTSPLAAARDLDRVVGHGHRLRPAAAMGGAPAPGDCAVIEGAMLAWC